MRRLMSEVKNYAIEKTAVLVDTLKSRTEVVNNEKCQLQVLSWTEIDVENEVRRVLVPRLQQGMLVDVNFGEWSGDAVSVSITVPMSAASPDMLWPIGFGLSGQNLFSETRMVRE